jgi:hypothetical protein
VNVESQLRGGFRLREVAFAVAKAMADEMADKTEAGHRDVKEMCHSTKRTHRFLTDFPMEVAMNKLVVQETREGNRWVRFGKRTHREASFGRVRLPQRLLYGISSDLVWGG